MFDRFHLAARLARAGALAWAATVALSPMAAQASDEHARHRLLHSFVASDGDMPTGGALVQGDDGFFYGTTTSGGKFECGVVFKFSSKGKFRVVHHFRGGDGGCIPRGGLMRGRDGNFYGTTYAGGKDTGTIYRMDPTGAIKTIHRFPRRGDAGHYPAATLVQARDGTFYGLTTLGGRFDKGTIFSMSSTGVVTDLYSFGSTPQDGSPWGGLVQGSDDRLYGVTPEGGQSNAGTVFAITSGGEYTRVHDFDGKDSGTPFSGLMLASNGKLYGSTYGARVFAISSQGEFEIVWRKGDCSMGCFPREAPLIEGPDHRLYGTSAIGGKFFYGTAFSIALDGSDDRLLYSFRSDDIGYLDGRDPVMGLTLGKDGRFYGTTGFGGGGQPDGVGYGTTFSLELR